MSINGPVTAPPVEVVPDKLKEWAQEVERVRKLHPNDAGVLYQVASLNVQAGRNAEALRALKQMIGSRAGLHPRDRDGFSALSGDETYKALIQLLHRESPPVRGAKAAFELAEADLVPEGIAWSQKQQRFYLGSVKKKIVVVDKKGQARDLVAPGRDGLGIVLGLRVDDQRGELIAVSHGPAGSKDVNGVFRYKLSDGKRLRSYAISVQTADLLNDAAVAPDGSIYVTSSNEGALYRIAPGGQTLDVFLPKKSLPDPNGISVTPDGKYLFIAGWYGIARVELATKEVKMLRKSYRVSEACIDGLYLRGSRELIGIQNCAHESGRVVRMTLDPSLERVESFSVLSSYEPSFAGVTTGAIADDGFYFMANTQLRKIGPDFRPLSSVRFDPIKILKVNLSPAP